MASIIPRHLTGNSFAAYLQLAEADRKKTGKVKGALLATFAVDPHMAYKQFVGRKLHTRELPDVYLAELQRLASLFGRMTYKALACAFMARLLENICQLLRAGSHMEALNLNQILGQAKVVIKDNSPLGSSEMCLGAPACPSVVPCVAPTSQQCCV